MHLKVPQKKTKQKKKIKKQKKQLVIWLAIKSLIKFTKVSKTSPHSSSETVTNQTENIGICRVIQKNIYFQKRDRKLLMI